MKELNEIRKRHGIPKHVKVKVVDYSELSDRKIIQRIKKIESDIRGQDETFEDASMINELQILRREVQRRKLQISA